MEPFVLLRPEDVANFPEVILAPWRESISFMPLAVTLQQSEPYSGTDLTSLSYCRILSCAVQTSRWKGARRWCCQPSQAFPSFPSLPSPALMSFCAALSLLTRLPRHHVNIVKSHSLQLVHLGVALMHVTWVWRD